MAGKEEKRLDKWRGVSSYTLKRYVGEIGEVLQERELLLNDLGADNFKQLHSRPECKLETLIGVSYEPSGFYCASGDFIATARVDEYSCTTHNVRSAGFWGHITS